MAVVSAAPSSRGCRRPPRASGAPRPSPRAARSSVRSVSRARTPAAAGPAGLRLPADQVQHLGCRHCPARAWRAASACSRAATASGGIGASRISKGGLLSGCHHRIGPNAAGFKRRASPARDPVPGAFGQRHAQDPRRVGGRRHLHALQRAKPEAAVIGRVPHQQNAFPAQARARSRHSRIRYPPSPSPWWVGCTATGPSSSAACRAHAHRPDPDRAGQRRPPRAPPGTAPPPAPPPRAADRRTAPRAPARSTGRKAPRPPTSPRPFGMQLNHAEYLSEIGWPCA